MNIIEDITKFIFVENTPEQADAIMVVGGSLADAGELAAQLWKDKFAPIILIGGGVSIKSGEFKNRYINDDKYNKAYKTEYDFYKDILIFNGVDENVIYGENQSSYTRQNAEFAKMVADENNLDLKKLILVCKSFHARRCLMFYQTYFPKAEILVIPFDGFGISKNNWFQSEYGIKRVLGELSRCGNQLTENDINMISKGGF